MVMGSGMKRSINICLATRPGKEIKHHKNVWLLRYPLDHSKISSLITIELLQMAKSKRMSGIQIEPLLGAFKDQLLGEFPQVGRALGNVLFLLTYQGGRKRPILWAAAEEMIDQGLESVKRRGENGIRRGFSFEFFPQSNEFLHVIGGKKAENSCCGKSLPGGLLLLRVGIVEPGVSCVDLNDIVDQKHCYHTV